jgi:hypothetical protein
MIEKPLIALGALVSSLVLFPIAVLGTDGHLLLVSSLEQSPSSTNACRFYSLDLKSSSIKTVGEIPFNKEQGLEVARIDAYPNLRKLVIWVQNSASSKVEGNVVNVDQLTDIQHIAFPKLAGIPRCYYLDDATSKPVAAVEIRSAEPVKRKLYSASRGARDGLMIQQEESIVDGQNVLLPGDTSSRLPVFTSIPLRYDRTGRRFIQDSTTQVRLEFSVDEKTAVLIEKEPSQPVSPRLLCNDRLAAVIIWGVPLENHVEARRYLFEKSTRSWKLLTAREDASKVQMFQNWISIQEECARGGGVFRMTGEFTFYSRDEDTSFTWRATSDDTLAQETEILAIWQKDLVYRIDTKLYQADIAKDAVTNERLIFDGKDVYKDRINLIHEVHWVFRLPE